MIGDFSGIPPFTYMSQSTAAAVAGTSIAGDSINIGDSAAMHGAFHTNITNVGDDIAGTITVSVSSDPRAAPGHPDAASAKWVNISSALTIAAVTNNATGHQSISFVDVGAHFIKLDWAFTSGDEVDITVWFSAKGG